MTFAASAATSEAPLRSSDASAAHAVTISLTSFDLAPDLLRLKAGRPIVLEVENDSGIAQDLTAPAFFAESRIGGADAARLKNGRISLEPHQSATLAIVPVAGRYSVKCGHPLHKTLGMSGTIMVDQ